MAGYFIYSADANVFHQLTTSPTKRQCLAMAESIADDVEYMLDEYEDEADPDKWPSDAADLAESIRARLIRADWYGDLTAGDAEIWNTILHELTGETGAEVGLDLRSENDGFLYWDAPALAAKKGAKLMAEPVFGNSGFRFTGKSSSDIDLMYSIHLPERTRELLAQLEAVVPHFEKLPDVPDGDRDQFFRGLLEPVRRIVAAGRVMWVQADT